MSSHNRMDYIHYTNPCINVLNAGPNIREDKASSFDQFDWSMSRGLGTCV